MTVRQMLQRISAKHAARLNAPFAGRAQFESASRMVWQPGFV
jgi:hypothetical protein